MNAVQSPVVGSLTPLSASVAGEAERTVDISVLVVDDDRVLREACASFLHAEGYAVTVTGSGTEALEMLKRRQFDFILCEMNLAQVPGIEILRAALAAKRDTLVVLMTAKPTVESNVQALQAGAWDYLLKPFTPTHLDVLVGRARQAITAARTAKDKSSHRLREVGNSELVTCIGVAPKFREAVRLARKVAASDASIMITGESGTGKEVIAQLIHRHSHRAGSRLVPINCAALPEPLLESEMFGHRKGAFTGADRDKPGLLEMAHNGTLFLDELTEMSLPLQAKLLRVLQDGAVRRVGSEQENAVVDVRFVSATNRDPHEAVGRNALRADLFYRLRVVLIELPPLRSRVEDIPILANHFLSYYWGRYRRTREPAPKLAASTLDLLRSRQWNGNVRELQNVMEHVAVVAESSQPIRPEDIPVYDEPTASGGDLTFPAALINEGYYTARDKVMADFERVYLTRLLTRAGGNMSKAARIASVDRTSLYRLMDRHGLTRNGFAEGDAGQAAG